MTQFPGCDGGKKLPRGLLDQLWAVRARGRRLLKDKRAGRMRVPGPAQRLLTPRARGQERRKRCVRWGAGEDGRQALNGERKPRRGRGRAGARAGEELRPDARTLPRLGSGSAGARGNRGASERSAGKRAPSGLLETRRIRFQINEIWVHRFTLLLPALMLF